MAGNKLLASVLVVPGGVSEEPANQSAVSITGTLPAISIMLKHLTDGRRIEVKLLKPFDGFAFLV
jgi:hypothetical protein